jgi:hypothetical protein
VLITTSLDLAGLGGHGARDVMVLSLDLNDFSPLNTYITHP